MDKNLLFSQPTPESVSLKLRQFRKTRGWSLQDVERETHGRIKAVVLGSYERGDRALSLKRTIELATLYGIPISSLLQTSQTAESPNRDQIVLDLRRLTSIQGQNDLKFESVLYFVRGIAQARSDWNGEVMSLRKPDLETLALMARSTLKEMENWLQQCKLLLTPLS